MAKLHEKWVESLPPDYGNNEFIRNLIRYFTVGASGPTKDRGFVQGALDKIPPGSNFDDSNANPGLAMGESLPWGLGSRLAASMPSDKDTDRTARRVDDEYLNPFNTANQSYPELLDLARKIQAMPDGWEKEEAIRVLKESLLWRRSGAR